MNQHCGQLLLDWIRRRGGLKVKLGFKPHRGRPIADPDSPLAGFLAAMAERKIVTLSAAKGYAALKSTLRLVEDKGQAGQLPKAFSTFDEKFYPDRALGDWITVVQVPPSVVIALAFVAGRIHRTHVSHAIHLLLKLMMQVTEEDELNLTVSDFVDKASRLSKLVERGARNDDYSFLKMLCTKECAIRIDEFWETLRSQYSGTNNMINRTVTVRQLREKISNTSIVNMGSLNQSHPPGNSNCHQIRLRAAWFPMTRVYWEKWAFNVMEREKTSMDEIESRAKTLWEILEGEGANLGYALRRHNAKMHQANTPGQAIIIQNVLEDWVSMRYDLTLERTAAVVHLQTMLLASAMLHEWVSRMETFKEMSSLRKTIQAKLKTVKGSFDLRSDIWEVGGYNVASADQGSFDAIEKRNRTFSCIRDFITTTSASQVAQGVTEIEHIDNWDIPLLPKDGRYPPAQGVPPTWDPHPIVMMNQQQSTADDERRRAQAGPAPPPPEPKARPTSTGGDASSSAGATGSSAKPPPKARPRPPDSPPDWVISEPPIGYKLVSSSNPDHRGTSFSSSAWMDENGSFLLSIIQGPAAAGPHVSGWSQYLRRVTAYGCMVFGVCNNNVVTDADAARISEKDWLKCYSHLARTYGLTRTGCYLSTAGLLMMLGKNDKDVAHLSGMGEIVKKICNPLACEIVENPSTQKSSDILSGKFRQGTTILITDLAHHIGTSTGRHDLGIGLQDMGWSIDLFKIHESQTVRPIDKFRDTVRNVIEYVNKDLNDQGLVTIHVWLSLQFLHDVKPPHSVMMQSSFQKEFIKCVTDLDQVASQPVIVAINTDSMFNCVDSITSRLAVELTEGLKREGVMVTTDQRMWRSMYSQFGSQFTTMRATKKGTLGKNAIWSVIEKNLFRQRVFLICATNREHVSTLNEGAYRPKDSGVDPEMLADVTVN